MNKKNLTVPLLAAAVLVGSATSAITLAGAASTDTTTSASATTRPAFTPPAAAGKVTAISGSTITLEDKKANTTYTVDASAASITKDRDTAGTIADIAVGDMIGVEGTVSGTAIAATAIHEGHGGMGGTGGHGGRGGGVMGTVSAVSGNTITVTDKDGGTYTIDAASATVKENGSASSLSSVQVGDTVMVRGKVTTASMTATDIEEGMPTPPAQGTTPSTPSTSTTTTN